MKISQKHLSRIVKVLVVYLSCCAVNALAQTELTTHNEELQNRVKIGLTVINRVVGHTGRLIEAGSYNQIAREQGEYDEGIENIMAGIADEPAAFVAKVKAQVDAANTASSRLVALGDTNEEAGIRAAHTEFGNAVAAVLAVFPESLRPDPNAPQTGGGRPR